MGNIGKHVIRSVSGFFYSFLVFLLALVIPPKHEFILFGGAPIIKFSRFAKALQANGMHAFSVVPSVYSINNREDFDFTWLSFVPKRMQNNSIGRLLAPAFLVVWVIRHARVICSPVGGLTFFSWFKMDFFEIFLLKIKRIKIVTLTGGGDSYMLGHISNPSTRHNLQKSYPGRGRTHRSIEMSVRLWEKHADVFLSGSMIMDGFARCDLLLPHMGIVDFQIIDEIMKNSNKLENDNKIMILHAPNHRDFKGTQFLMKAVDELQDEGLKIDLQVVSNLKNDELLYKISQSDIVVDQIVATGYGNFAIEAMAFGKPTIVNLEDFNYRELMNNYSILKEAPLVSAGINSIKSVLLQVISNPNHDKNAFESGRLFAQKYHSSDSFVKVWQLFENVEFCGEKLIGESVLGIFQK